LILWIPAGIFSLTLPSIPFPFPTEVSDFKKDSSATTAKDETSSKKDTKSVTDSADASVRSSIFRRRPTVFVDNRFSIAHFTRWSIKPDPDIEANSNTSGLIQGSSTDKDGESDMDDTKITWKKNRSLARRLSIISTLLHFLLFGYFLAATILSTFQSSHHSFHAAVYDSVPLGAVTVGMFFGIITVIRDPSHVRFTLFQRLVYTTSALIYFLGCTVLLARTQRSSHTDVDKITLAALISYIVWVGFESLFCPLPSTLKPPSDEASQNKAHLSRKAILIILKPYFWPHATSNSANLNRMLALSTWVCVAGSKACSLISPIILGKASTALTQLDYWTASKLSIYYCVLQFASNLLKEGQSLVYLSVAKAAFIQLSELSFHHLHSLSLDWHLRKKLGEGTETSFHCCYTVGAFLCQQLDIFSRLFFAWLSVIRSMDRGIQACDTLMRYLFLYMIPALAECVLVVIIFATYFHYLPIAVNVFLFVFVYVMITIILTVWRKKFRYRLGFDLFIHYAE
jgi:hypothetical protein